MESIIIDEEFLVRQMGNQGTDQELLQSQVQTQTISQVVEQSRKASIGCHEAEIQMLKAEIKFLVSQKGNRGMDDERRMASIASNEEEIQKLKASINRELLQSPKRSQDVNERIMASIARTKEVIQMLDESIAADKDLINQKFLVRKMGNHGMDKEQPSKADYHVLEANIAEKEAQSMVLEATHTELLARQTENQYDIDQGPGRRDVDEELLMASIECDQVHMEMLKEKTKLLASQTENHALDKDRTRDSHYLTLLADTDEKEALCLEIQANIAELKAMQLEKECGMHEETRSQDIDEALHRARINLDESNSELMNAKTELLQGQTRSQVVNERLMASISSNEEEIQKLKASIAADKKRIEERKASVGGGEPMTDAKILESFHQLALKEKRSFSSIYPVPNQLREGEKNEVYYTPRVVSIGPHHRGNTKYAAMEIIKQLVLHAMTSESTEPFSYYLKIARDDEKSVRDCYSERAVGEAMTSDEYALMMLADGAFIIKFMADLGESNRFEYYMINKNNEKEKVEHYLTAHDVAAIRHDLTLLENQLPFTFLQTLNDSLLENTEAENTATGTMWKSDLTSLAANIWPRLLPRTPVMDQLKPHHHLLDLLRSSKLPATMTARNKAAVRGTPDLALRRTIKSAKKLQQSGVKVMPITQPCQEYAIFSANGKLMISPLEINDASLALYKNIVAFEQCCHIFDAFVSHYLVVMEMLIRDDSEELLVKNNVIVNKLSTAGATAGSVLRDLCQNIAYKSNTFSMGALCKSVEEYCDRPTGKLKAAFNRMTWQAAVSIGLFLTLIQTICSILDMSNVKLRRSP